MGARGEGAKGSEGEQSILYTRGSPPPLWGQRERERKGVKGSEAYCVLGFRGGGKG